MGDKDETALPVDPSQIIEKVRDRYGRIAEGKEPGCCPTASSSCGDPAAAVAVAIGYQGRDLEAVPADANLGLGCGAPIDVLDLKPGETVLDLGSGPGLDAFLAARRVGTAGRLVISDILLDGPLPRAVATDLLAYVGCVAGAMPRQAYFDLVKAAGLTGVRIHKDIDYLAAGGYTFTDELQARLDESGVRPEDLRGKVRSVTWGAGRPAV